MCWFLDSRTIRESVEIIAESSRTPRKIISSELHFFLYILAEPLFMRFSGLFKNRKKIEKTFAEDFSRINFQTSQATEIDPVCKNTFSMPR